MLVDLRQAVRATCGGQVPFARRIVPTFQRLYMLGGYGPISCVIDTYSDFCNMGHIQAEGYRWTNCF